MTARAGLPLTASNQEVVLCQKREKLPGLVSFPQVGGKLPGDSFTPALPAASVCAAKLWPVVIDGAAAREVSTERRSVPGATVKNLTQSPMEDIGKLRICLNHSFPPR
ncbi:unnamed protein product [Pleuronectes platessa]|uniref:Uncharacterized protein n=1 Tax=Pleuronectes platessa TaxID=8262 RepID=A0A9N7VKS4_PLEPL|nr:unnamed protein product [Pleuronectes platessa]